MFIYAALVIKALLARSRTQASPRRSTCSTVSLLAAGALSPWLVTALWFAWIMKTTTRRLAEAMEAANATEASAHVQFG